MSRRTVALLLALLAIAPALASAGTGPEARVTCPGPTTSFAPAPARPDAATDPTTLARRDPDGWTTLTVAIDDPAIGEYTLGRLTTTEGTYAHVWPGDRALVTLGTYTWRAGPPVRAPHAILEGAGLLNLVANDALDLGTSSAAVIAAFAAVATAPVEPASRFSHEPLFVWTSYRVVDDRELWSGFAITRQADTDARDGTSLACQRTEIHAMLRDETGTRALAGVYVQIEEDRTVAPGTTRTERTITYGATRDGIDAPVAVVRGEHTEELFVDGSRAEHETAIGIRDDRGDFLPLLGIRNEIELAPAPDRETRTISIGTYDRHGRFFPQIGSRSSFDESTSGEWSAALGVDGPGHQAGDLQEEIGAYDPHGVFVPLVGVTYDDELSSVGRADAPTGIRARYERQALVTTGVFAGESYQPLLAATYDGEQALLTWQRAQSTAGGDPGSWLASAGAFAPVVGYVPLVGVEHDEEGVGAARTERTDVGVFAGSYDVFVPLARAEWRSDQPLVAWWARVALTQRASGNGTLSVGAVVADGFVPIVTVDERKRTSDEWSVVVAGQRVVVACVGGPCG